MTKLIYTILLLTWPVLLMAQNPNGNYNPYVNNGMISPSPLSPIEVSGAGVISFNIGNTGSDPLQIYADQFITLTITLSQGEPDNLNPLLAVSGSAATLFSWTYNSETTTYSGVQTATITSGSSGTINIDYKVTENSTSPGLNGFNVNISPAPYHTESNTQNDDAVSSYTYTEIRDYGDAPESYGSASHSIDFENYLGVDVDGDPNDQASINADGDDLNGLNDDDGVVFPALIQQGETVGISVTVSGLGRLNAWIDWNGDGDFDGADEQVADNVGQFDGTSDLSVTVPIDAIISMPTFTRFRFSPGTLDSYSGSASGGEVEDYKISISASPLAPTVPTALKIDSSSVNYVSISWNASSGEEGVAEYRIYRDGGLLGTSANSNYIDNTVSSGSSYIYTVTAVNADDLESPMSAGVTANINDTSAPSVPTGLKITSISETEISLSWDASTDNVGVTGYRIYKNGTLLTTTSNLYITDNAVMVGNSYAYTVSAFDEAENESEQSSSVNASINDTTAPSIPEDLRTNSVSVLSVSFSWDASTDNVGVTAYNLYRDENLIATTSELNFIDNTVNPGNEYNYSISALDAAGNESAQSASISVNTNDTESPTSPTGLQASSVSGTSVSLTWEASSDNVGISFYEIYRGGVLLASSNILSYTDNTVSPENSYSYIVVAVDAAGNSSSTSTQLTVFTTDTSPPSIPSGLVVTSASENGLVLNWDASSDNVGIAGYRVFRDGNMLTTVNSTSNTDNTVVEGGTYFYSVSAFDEAGNESIQSDTLTVSISSIEYLIVSELSIYPNPSDGKFVIEINEKSGRFNLEIVSANGIMVARTILDLNEASITLSYDTLEAGIYTIRIFNSERIYYGRLMIIR